MLCCEVDLDMTNKSCSSGIPKFMASYNYIRKKNLVELNLKQEVPRGANKFVVSTINSVCVCVCVHLCVCVCAHKFVCVCVCV